uniref:Uncharacterized protein n=1 Tax=Moniliophthora roreri TaxID=221103 RepID=A0A0W0F669_MONRR
MSFKPVGIYPANPTTDRGVSTKLSASKDRIVYTNGKSVIIRDLNNPSASIAYAGHVQNATVARISPSGYYCASADAGGTVRVWDTVGEDQTLKGEYKVISGRINDLEWDGESKRILAVGDGKEKFGHAFMMDSGSSTGEISGHSKAINAVSIRHQRPFRAATAADDALIIFHQGKNHDVFPQPDVAEKTIRCTLQTIKTHTKFVQDVRYAPSGDLFASVGSDYKFFVYDGKNGDTVAEITDSPHKGSVMAVSWSSDSRSLVTSSADWDIETRKAVQTWTVGSGVNHQQVGNVWNGEKDIVSLSLGGDLNVFDHRMADQPSRVINAPQKSITAIAPLGSDAKTFIAGSADGRVLSFDTISGGKATHIQGQGHTGYVTGLASGKDKVYSSGFDDRIREIDITSSNAGFTQASFATASQPKSLAIATDDSVVIAEINGVEVIRSNQKVFNLQTKFTPSAVATSKSELVVAIGGEDQKTRLYDWDGSVLKEKTVLEGNKAVVSALAFSPDGKLLAAGDSSGRICLFDVKETKLITSRWSFHTARINSLAWTPDSKHCASGSLDTHVYIWSVAKPLKNIALKNVGPGGVNAVLWIDADGAKGELASAGFDACVKVWEVTFHPA